jgi:hypothetical protein
MGSGIVGGPGSQAVSQLVEWILKDGRRGAATWDQVRHTLLIATTTEKESATRVQ